MYNKFSVQAHLVSHLLQVPFARSLGLISSFSLYKNVVVSVYKYKGIAWTEVGSGRAQKL
jgi:hypothetical protein